MKGDDVCFLNDLMPTHYILIGEFGSSRFISSAAKLGLRRNLRLQESYLGIAFDVAK